MLAAQAEIEQQKIKKEQELKIKKEQEEVRKAKELDDQKLREELNRERTKIVEKLEEEKKLKALEILNVLLVKGFKKIGKEKIKDLIDHNKAEFNTVIDFYQNVLKKEREQIEEEKKKKLREVELWTRAIREEEKIAIEKYAQEHGDKEMEQI